MSVTRASLPLGLGNLYFKRPGDADGNYTLVGTLGGDVELTYSPETAERKVGDVLGPVKRVLVDEHATLKASVVDFKIAQLIVALGKTTSTSQLTGTRSMRIMEQLDLGSTTGTKTLSHSAKSITSVRVFSLDRGTEKVFASDFTMAATTGITAKSTTTANTVHRVFYTFLNATARRVRMGDQSTLEELSILFVHKKTDGRHIQVEMPLCTVMEDIVIPWHEKEYTGYDITFSALANTNLPQGQKLFTITEEV